jgi:hypothetical protein
MRIEILYLEGCPNHRVAVERVREILEEESVPAEIIEITVQDEASAQAYEFLGSPTVRVDGIDIEREARSSNAFGMTCRTYLEAGQRVGVPPRDWILRAVREAAYGTRGGLDCCQAPGTRSSAGEPAQPSSKIILLSTSVVAALAASLCCILPIVAAVTGLGVFATSEVLGKWRPYLLGFTGLLLTAGFVLAYRDYRKACTPIRRWSFTWTRTQTRSSRSRGESGSLARISAGILRRPSSWPMWLLAPRWAVSSARFATVGIARGLRTRAVIAGLPDWGDHGKRVAFGWPGIEPRWTQGNKDGAGTAYSGGSRGRARISGWPDSTRDERSRPHRRAVR